VSALLEPRDRQLAPGQKDLMQSIIDDVPVELQACEACRETECDCDRAAQCPNRIEGERQERAARAFRNAEERVSIAACSRILRQIEIGVEELNIADTKRLARNCNQFIADPSALLARMVLVYCVQAKSLIQLLEPPLDGWSPNA